ncbi:hypothetical protein FJZ19_00010 [Candidatus Pacearchaeota archaeon]|nr:hypothetical protein [Candidatus Pacearchaeota archaeon]
MTKYTTRKSQRIKFYREMNPTKISQVQRMRELGIEFVECAPRLFERGRIYLVYHTGKATSVVRNPSIENNSPLVNIAAETEFDEIDAKRRLEVYTGIKVIKTRR